MPDTEQEEDQEETPGGRSMRNADDGLKYKATTKGTEFIKLQGVYLDIKNTL